MDITVYLTRLEVPRPPPPQFREFNVVCECCSGDPGAHENKAFKLNPESCAFCRNHFLGAMVNVIARQRRLPQLGPGKEVQGLAQQCSAARLVMPLSNLCMSH